MLTEDIFEKKEVIKNYLSNIGVDVSSIKNEELMLEAFVHKSYAADFTKPISHNERLEFLGDSILGAIIAKLLFLEFPGMEESKLTLFKIALVRLETLGDVALDIYLNKMLFLGNGEERSGGRTKLVILGDAVEALIGYLYVDLGIEEVEKFIKKYIYCKMDIIKDLNVRSFKSLLQEFIQKTYKELPVYKDHEFEKDEKGNITVYKSEVYLMNEKKGEGYGSNKKKSQEEAAKNAFTLLNTVEK